VAPMHPYIYTYARPGSCTKANAIHGYLLGISSYPPLSCRRHIFGFRADAKVQITLETY
jgi:hypothetical protein